MATITRIPASGKAAFTGRSFNPFAATSNNFGDRLAPPPASAKPVRRRSAKAAPARVPTIDIAYGPGFVAEFKKLQENHRFPAGWSVNKVNGGRVRAVCPGSNCSCEKQPCPLHRHGTQSWPATASGLRSVADEAQIFVTELYRVCTHSGIAPQKHAHNGLRSSGGR